MNLKADHSSKAEVQCIGKDSQQIDMKLGNSALRKVEIFYHTTLC